MASLGRRYSDESTVVAAQIMTLKGNAKALLEGLSNLSSLQLDLAERLEKEIDGGRLDSESSEAADAETFSELDLTTLSNRIDSVLEDLDDLNATLSSIQFEIL